MKVMKSIEMKVVIYKKIGLIEIVMNREDRTRTEV